MEIAIRYNREKSALHYTPLKRVSLKVLLKVLLTRIIGNSTVVVLPLISVAAASYMNSTTAHAKTKVLTQAEILRATLENSPKIKELSASANATTNQHKSIDGMYDPVISYNLSSTNTPASSSLTAYENISTTNHAIKFEKLRL